MPRSIDPRQLMGRNLLGRRGETLGKVEQVFLNDQTGAPEFATVRTGLFGSRQSFVPLAQAQLFGDAVSVPYDKDTIKGAPHIDADEHLSGQQEQKLYSYYQLAYSGLPESGLVPESTSGNSAGAAESSPDADEAMIRSEEQMQVGAGPLEPARVRLRKYVVTEHTQQTLTVTREEIQVVPEPSTADNAEGSTPDPDIFKTEPTRSSESFPNER
jgi:hypothetical protein